MIRLSEIDILAARGGGQARGELSPDKRAAHCEQTTDYPHAKYQKWRMHSVRYLGRIGENSRAYDAAHHEHGGIEQSKLTAWL